jgi:GNAT superfamily N-acetyltransferase
VSVALRPPRDDDAEAVAELASASSPIPVTAEEVRRSWTDPSLDPARDSRVALRGDEIVGAINVEQEGEEDVRPWLDLDALDPEAAAVLLEWGRSRAREIAAGPLLAGVWGTHAVVKAALEADGFRLRRHTDVMGMELDAEPAPPVWPNGVTVRPYEEADAAAVYEATVEAFQDTWEPLKLSLEQWLHWHPDRELWFLAVAGEELAGVVLCRREESDETRGWIAVLGVRRPYRRHGLGAALLQHALREVRAAGCTHLGLGVDSPSRTGAERLYERAGMRVEHRYDLYEHSG